MGIINQPKVSNIGLRLLKLLDTEESNKCKMYIIAAYAKISGVSRIKKAIEKFRNQGGSVVAIIGVDQKTTSIQALQQLLKITDETYIYHSESFYQTFHPKIYIFEKNCIEANVFIGSGNLTGGGLFTNYETFYEQNYQLSNEEHLKEYESIIELINSYKDIKSPCCKRLTISLLKDLIKYNYLDNEEISRRPSFGGNDKNSNSIQKIFGIEMFKAPKIQIINEIDSKKILSEIEIIYDQNGFWKKLSRFDVNPTSAPGQIIIPKRYQTLFPDFSEYITTNSGGKQAEVFFNVIFNDHNNNSILIMGVRAILYIPAPNHPRPNTELRFTFLERNILNMLEFDDILSFKRLINPDFWFEINHIKKDSELYSEFPNNKRYNFFDLS